MAIEGLDIGSLVGGIELEDKLTPALTIAENKLLSTAATVQKFGGVMTGVGLAMTPLSAAIIGAGVASVSAATNLNASLANISALLTDVSGPQLDQVTGDMKDKIQSMAVDLGKSTTDISSGLYEVISSLGFTKDSFAQLEISAKAGAAGLASTQESFKFLSAVTKGYGDTSEAAFKKVANLGFQAVNLGQTTFPELAASIGGVVPIAKVAGISLEEMFAVIATATGVTGSSTNEVVTQMASAITSLLSPSAQMSAAFEDMGVSSGKALIHEKGFVGALQAVAAQAEKTNVPLIDLVGRKEAFIITSALAGAQAQDFSNKLGAMGKAGAANADILDAAFKKQTQGVNAAGFAWKQFTSDVEVQSQRLGDVLIARFETLGTIVFKPLWEGAKLTISSFLALPPAAQTAGVTIAGGLAVAGPALLALGTAARLVPIAFEGWETIRGVIFTVGNTIPILTARFALLQASTAAAASYNSILAASEAGVATAMDVTGASAVILATRQTAVSVATRASAIASGVAQTAQVVLTAALDFTGASSLVMGARMAIASAATRVMGVAGLTTATSLTTLAGSFAGVIAAVTLIGGSLAVLGVALYQTGIGIKNLYNAASAGGFTGFWNKFTEQDKDNVIRRWLGMEGSVKSLQNSMDSAESKAQQFQSTLDHVSGADTARSLSALASAAIEVQKAGPLADESITRIATAAMELQKQGATLPPVLASIVDQFKQMNQETPTAAISYMQKLADARTGLQKILSDPVRTNELTSALQLGTDSVETIAKRMQVSQATVELFKTRFQQSQQEIHKTSDEVKTLSNQLSGLNATRELATLLTAWNAQPRAIQNNVVAQKALLEGYEKLSPQLVNVPKHLQGAVGGLNYLMMTMGRFDVGPVTNGLSNVSDVSKEVKDSLAETLIEWMAFETATATLSQRTGVSFGLDVSAFGRDLGNVEQDYIGTILDMTDRGTLIHKTGLAKQLAQFDIEKRKEIEGYARTEGRGSDSFKALSASADKFYEHLKNQTVMDEFIGNLDKLAQGFAQLSQIAGPGALGSVFTTLGTIASSGSLAANSIKSIGAGAATLKNTTGFAGTLSGIASMASGYIGVAIAAYTAGKAIYSALNPPDWKRTIKEIKEEWKGVGEIGEEVAKRIEHTMKTRFEGMKNNRWMAEVLNLGSVIQDVGGITNKNVGAFTEQLRQTFVFLQEGSFDAKDAVDTLDGAWGQFTQGIVQKGGTISRELAEIVALSRAAGIQSAAMGDFVKGQLDKTAGGLAALARGFTATQTGGPDFDPEKVNDLAVKVGKLKAQIGELNEKDHLTPKQEAQLKAWQNELRTTQRELDDLRDTQQRGERIADELATGSQERFDRVGRLTVATFQAGIASGDSFLEALQRVQPATESLRESLDYGFVAQTPLADLLGLSDFVNKNKEAVEAATGLNDILEGLTNTAFMTQASFSDIALEAVSQMHELEVRGASASNAFQMMQPTWQTLWEQVEDYHFAVDDATKAILDQAEAEGKVGDQHRSVQEQMLIASDRMADATEYLAEQFGYLPEKVNAFGDSVAALPSKFDPLKQTISDTGEQISGLPQRLGELGDTTVFDRLGEKMDGNTGIAGGLAAKYRDLGFELQTSADQGIGALDSIGDRVMDLGALTGDEAEQMKSHLITQLEEAAAAGGTSLADLGVNVSGLKDLTAGEAEAMKASLIRALQEARADGSGEMRTLGGSIMGLGGISSDTANEIKFQLIRGVSDGVSESTMSIGGLRGELHSLGPITAEAADSARRALASIGRDIPEVKIGYKFEQRGPGIPEAPDTGGFTIQKFATGGYVQSTGSSDTELAKVAPGEFILTPQAAASVGPARLEQLNMTGSMGGEAVIHVENVFHVNAIDAQSVAEFLNDPQTQNRIADSTIEALDRGHGITTLRRLAKEPVQ